MEPQSPNLAPLHSHPHSPQARRDNKDLLNRIVLQRVPGTFKVAIFVPLKAYRKFTSRAEGYLPVTAEYSTF